MVSGADEFTAYVEASWARLFRIAYALVGDVAEADELLQSTLVKTYVSWRRVSRAEAPDAYVRRIMINQAATHWRREKQQRRTRGRAQTGNVSQNGPASDLVDRHEIWEMIQGLPPRQRAIIVLRYYEDLTELEIADALEIAPGTVKSQASAAIARLRIRATANAQGEG